MGILSPQGDLDFEYCDYLDTYFCIFLKCFVKLIKYKISDKLQEKVKIEKVFTLLLSQKLLLSTNFIFHKKTIIETCNV